MSLLHDVRQKADASIFNPAVQLDRFEMAELSGSLGQFSELTLALEDSLEAIEIDVGNANDEAKLVKDSIAAAVKLVEINNLPEHFKLAFLPLFEKMADQVDLIIENTDTQPIAELLWEVQSKGIEV